MSNISHQPLPGVTKSKYNAKNIFGSLSLIGLIAFVAKNKIVQLHRIGCIKPSQHIIEAAKKSSYRINISCYKVLMGIKIPIACKIGFGMSYMIRPNLLVTNYHVAEPIQNVNSRSFVKSINIRDFNGKVIASGKVVHCKPSKDLSFSFFC